MTHEELLLQVRNLYLEAREPRFFYDKKHNAISRCTSHSISSEYEDLLAQYCFELINDETVEIFIDPQMKFPKLDLKNSSGEKTFIFRPDIVIVKNNKIVFLIDAKTDLGYLKSIYTDVISKMNNTIGLLAGQYVEFNRRTKGVIQKLEFSQQIKLAYLVASNEYITKIPVPYKDLNSSHSRVNIFFLSSGGHLNNYKNGVEEVGNGINVNESFIEFDKLILAAVNNQ